jgi:hypothetical protein
MVEIIIIYMAIYICMHVYIYIHTYCCTSHHISILYPYEWLLVRNIQTTCAPHIFHHAAMAATSDNDRATGVVCSTRLDLGVHR